MVVPCPDAVNIHPKADEEFTVHSGRLAIVIDGERRSPDPARRSPSRAVRRISSSTLMRGETEFGLRFTPAQNHLRFFLAFSMATQTHPDNEWFGPKGEPKLLGMAIALHTSKD